MKKKIYGFIFILVVIWLLLIFFVTSVNKTPTKATIDKGPSVDVTLSKQSKQRIKPAKKYDVFKAEVKRDKGQKQKIQKYLRDSTQEALLM